MKSSSLLDSGAVIPAIPRRRGDPIPWAAGLLASVAIHVLLVLAWRVGSPTAAVSPTEARRTAIRVPSPVPVIVAAASNPAPRPRVPRPVQAAAEDVHRADLSKVAVPPSRMPEITGTGSGAGERPESPTPREGDLVGGRDRPPIPVAILPDWRPPPRAVGHEMTLRVFVTAEGRPTGLVEIVTGTPDHGFNRRVADRVRRLAYRPALRDGTAAAGWAEISFVFCKATVTAMSPPGPRPDPLCAQSPRQRPEHR